MTSSPIVPDLKVPYLTYLSFLQCIDELLFEPVHYKHLPGNSLVIMISVNNMLHGARSGPTTIFFSAHMSSDIDLLKLQSLEKRNLKYLVYNSGGDIVVHQSIAGFPTSTST